MQRRLSVLTLGFVGLVGVTTSCGADEGTGDDGGTSTGCAVDEDCRRGAICDDIRGNNDDFCDAGETCQCISVSGGTGGASGASGTQGGSGGSIIGGAGGKGGTGTGGGTATGALGRACTTDTQCGGAPFVCLTSGGLPDGSGPPLGLCTLPCAADDECLERAPSAYCADFSTDGSLQYCIEGCVSGVAGIPKCHQRPELACSLYGSIATTLTCADSTTCAIGQLCFEGLCQEIVTACLPMCGHDAHCAAGQFCDFASGFCVEEEPTGLPIGSLCDPTLPAAQDPCNGFCSATDATETEGTCAAFCSLNQSLVGCGWDGQGSAEAACLYSTILARSATGAPDLAPGDLMLCGQLCDCNDDCPAAIERCVDESADGDIMTLFGRSGYCRPLITGETEASTIACAAASGQGGR